MKYAVLQPPWLQNNLRAQEITAAASAGLMRSGVDWICTTSPEAAIEDADRIVVWGLGHPLGQKLIKDAAKARTTVIGFDLGYWRRTGPQMRFRVTINDEHPQRYVMAKTRPLDRMLEDGIKLREDANAAGPVILVGMGRKSADTYGEKPGEWEQRAVAAIRRVWPSQKILFRPKAGGGDHVPHGVNQVQVGGAIEDVLNGAAAVVCRHSNVAVDAIIAGVPCAAEDGAAAAVLRPLIATLSPPALLPQEDRATFLGNLAWFQWSAAELRSPETWGVIDDIIRSVS